MKRLIYIGIVFSMTENIKLQTDKNIVEEKEIPCDDLDEDPDYKLLYVSDSSTREQEESPTLFSKTVADTSTCTTVFAAGKNPGSKTNK